MKGQKAWIRKAAWGMAAVMTAAMPMTAEASPDFAYSPERWETLRDNVMEYEELADLVHEYNATVQNNRVEYQDYYDKDQDDLSNEYFKRAAEAADMVQYPNEEDSGYAARYADAMAAEVTIRKLRQEGLDNLEDGEIKGWTYERAEASTVQGVQKNMVEYNRIRCQLRQAEETKRYQEALYASVQKKAAAGIATESDVLTAKQRVQDAETSIAQLNRSLQDIRQGLCVATGWKYDAQPEIREVPSTDGSEIGSLNPETDKETALEKNYTLKINRRRLANSRDKASTSKYEIAVKDNEQKIVSDIDLAYNAVLQAKVSYEQAKAEYAVEERSLLTARRKWESGAISELEYLQQESSAVQKEVNAKLKELDLFQAMETYRWNVKGLGSSV